MASECSLHRNAFAVSVLTMLLAAAFADTIHAAERRPAADTVHTLVALGCANIPEEGPRAMNCVSDAGYFLCTVFEKLGKPVECSGATTPAIRDMAKLSDDHFLHSELPDITKKTPCAIWAYPEDDAIKIAAGRRCALQVLKALHCTTTPDANALAKDVAETKTSAICPKQHRRTCASLEEAGLIDRCGP